MPTIVSPDFISNSFQNLARSNRFTVVFNSPLEAGRNPLYIACRRAQWPSLSFSTSTVKMQGPSFQLPYEQTLEEVQLEFFIDDKYENYHFFKKWFEKIIDPNTKNLEYYINYAEDVEIFQLDSNGEVIDSVKLLNAFPKTISEMDFAHDNDNEFQTFNVSFVYDGLEFGNSLQTL